MLNKYFLPVRTNQAQFKQKMLNKNRQINSQNAIASKTAFLITRQNHVITFVSKRDSSYYTDKDKVVSITYEEIGLFPRSFSRVLDRFLKQLFSDVDNLVIQEYRFYRYLFLTTIKTIFILFFVPFLVNFAAKNYIVKPITEYFWNTSHPEIFLNSYEQKRAFVEFEKFEEKLYFETLVESDIGQNIYNSTNPAVDFIGNQASIKRVSNLLFASRFFKEQSRSQDFVDSDFFITQPSTNYQYSVPIQAELDYGPSQQIAFLNSKDILFNKPFSINDFKSVSHLTFEKQKTDAFDYNVNINQDALTTGPIIKKTKNLAKVYQDASHLIFNHSAKYQEKAIELATYYNNHSIEAITNFFADLLSLCTLLYLLITLSIQINITKSFLLEVFFGLDDSKKSLLILLITDLLVGYHSSNLWELFFEFIFNHYGIPESQTGIFLLVATLPVLLDVLFKYLIFRHLNRSSPATVATYQAIIE
uniref:Chloroplast enveloppe membrane protein n=1 Tax=Pandorina colemaniae TaxID=47786 RepID=A0A6C0RV21_9CHLO|nr:chloroplast enveloppe membrane protein [Pandorina colemaniae]